MNKIRKFFEKIHDSIVNWIVENATNILLWVGYFVMLAAIYLAGCN